MSKDAVAFLNTLDELARDIVGDGQTPNVYFVTSYGKVQTITLSSEVAYEHWKDLVYRAKQSEPCLEDRLVGTICSVERREDDGYRFDAYDDYSRWKDGHNA